MNENNEIDNISMKSRFFKYFKENDVLRSLITIILYLLVINYLGSLIIGDILALTLNSNGSSYQEFIDASNNLGQDIALFPEILQQSYYTASSIAQLVIYIVILIFVVICLHPIIKKDFKLFFSYKPTVKSKKTNGYFDPESNTYFSYLDSSDNLEIENNSNNKTNRLPKIASYILIAYVLNIVGGLISTGLKYIEGGGTISETNTRNQESINQLLSSSFFNLLLVCFVIIFLAPFVEELIFRKSIFNIFHTKYLSIVISGITFGFAHTINSGYTNPFLLFANTVPYLILGFYLAYIYERENRNIVTNIFVHIGINTISVFFLLLTL